MFPCLSAARIILDGLRLDSLRDGATERPDRPLAMAEAARARRSLLPRTWAAALARRAERRALAAALDRLGATSPHLLADVGLSLRGEPLEPEVANVHRLRPAVPRPILRPATDEDGLPIAAE